MLDRMGKGIRANNTSNDTCRTTTNPLHIWANIVFHVYHKKDRNSDTNGAITYAQIGNTTIGTANVADNVITSSSLQIHT